MSLDIYIVPIACPHCGRHDDGFSANITHNLTTMAEALGIYECLWNNEKVGVKTAGQLIKPLKTAIKSMKDDPEKYKKFNAKNGWGTYNDFLPWLEDLLDACQESPESKIDFLRESMSSSFIKA